MIQNIVRHHNIIDGRVGGLMVDTNQVAGLTSNQIGCETLQVIIRNQDPA